MDNAGGDHSETDNRTDVSEDDNVNKLSSLNVAEKRIQKRMQRMKRVRKQEAVTRVMSH